MSHPWIETENLRLLQWKCVFMLKSVCNSTKGQRTQKAKGLSHIVNFDCFESSKFKNHYIATYVYHYHKKHIAQIWSMLLTTMYMFLLLSITLQSKVCSLRFFFHFRIKHKTLFEICSILPADFNSFSKLSPLCVIPRWGSSSFCISYFSQLLVSFLLENLAPSELSAASFLPS